MIAWQRTKTSADWCCKWLDSRLGRGQQGYRGDQSAGNTQIGRTGRPIDLAPHHINTGTNTGAVPRVPAPNWYNTNTASVFIEPRYQWVVAYSIGESLIVRKCVNYPTERLKLHNCVDYSHVASETHNMVACIDILKWRSECELFSGPRE